MNCEGCKYFREPYSNFPCIECKRINNRGIIDYWRSEEVYVDCSNCKYLFTDECEYPCSDCNMLNTLYENNHFTPKDGKEANCESCKFFRESCTIFPCNECKRIHQGELDYWTSEIVKDIFRKTWTEEEEMNSEENNMEMELKMESSENVMSPPQKPKPDNVNHPSHYESSCSLECIEVMEIMFGFQYVYGFCLCNAWKYIWRYKNKNGIEDLKKARWYIDRAKWYEADHGDEIYYPNGTTLSAMDNWLLEHDIV